MPIFSKIGDRPVPTGLNLGDSLVHPLLSFPPFLNTSRTYVGSCSLQLKLLKLKISLIEPCSSAGAEPNLSGCCGDTPLSRAVKQGNTGIAQTLLDAGANPNHAHKEDVVVRDIKIFLVRENLIGPEQ